MYIVIRDMSAGNETTGEAWQETKCFSKDATLKQVMDWAMEDWQGLGYSRKHITITKSHPSKLEE